MSFVRSECLLVAGLFLLTAACGSGNPTPGSSAIRTASPVSTNPAFLQSSQPDTIPTHTTAAVTPQGLGCAAWQTWPVIPTISTALHPLYERGLADGNDPHSFSKVGDGEIATEWFFAAFDLGPHYYDLGPYPNLAPAIEYFDGSFERIGVAARRGFNTQRILDPKARDRSLCQTAESPLACELRLHRPAFVILSLGTNQVWQPQEFEQGLRQILDILLARNVVPILSTKGDNLEGDHRINRLIACLAQEYDVPLWNFWAALQSLPGHGLQADGEHLTYYGITDFDDQHAMQSAWTIRNLTGLQALDQVWRKVTQE